MEGLRQNEASYTLHRITYSVDLAGPCSQMPGCSVGTKYIYTAVHNPQLSISPGLSATTPVVLVGSSA